jgi:ABC-type uncharacterized transport system fused permease/ATPase subunit
MKPRAIALIVLMIPSWGLSANAAFADQGKDADLLARIQQLEKRVAELEQAIKQLRALEKRVAELEQAIKQPRESAKEAPRTETENKVVGTWVVSDADKKVSPFTDLKLKDDGTCAVVVTDSAAALPNGKYQIIGMQIVFTVKIGGNASFSLGGRLLSVTDTELVMEYKKDDALVKVRYLRAK